MSTLETERTRKPLRLEVRNAQTPREKHPQWLRITAKSGSEYLAMRELMSGAKLHTVCAEAGCPNIHECWEDREATFLVGGAICTRRCGFCDIASGKPEPIDPGEPERLAQTVSHLGLKYVTITGVTRDDQPEAAAWLYAEATRQIHAACPETGVELLVDDFRGARRAVEEVFSAEPQVFGHNLETVPRLMHRVRPAFDYHRTLDIISQARSRGLITKSNLMLGLGEERHEVEATMRDMLNAGVDILTITQYLRPSPRYLPIERWVKPQEFVELKNLALEMGFAACMSGPLVRSSYRAGKLWVAAMRHYERLIPPQFAHLEDGSDKPAWQEAEKVLERQQQREQRCASAKSVVCA
ncbi:lipoyl synthase [Mobiluncus mulieris]|uniref:lipoyl synthase n=1 Tax=Mobiluncus mulieris TaxID=2052 RepID=UPI0021E1CF30|nr:lipoyl synthase [Mobiluncus mulieris]MCU9996792.1 lipoyl synthase [Mobiluncus mulieris]